MAPGPASASAQPSYLQLLSYMRLRVDAGEALVPPWMIPGWIHPRDPYAQAPEDFAAALLPLAAADGTTAWYAFHWARPKNAGDRRRSRVVTGGGSWKSERAAVPVNSTVDGAVVQAGWRTPFAYTFKIPGGGEHRPGWVMQELLLPDDAGVVGLQELTLSKIYRTPWGKNRSCSSTPLAAAATSSASLAASPAAGASCSASLAQGACSFSPAASLAAGACSASPAAFSLAPEASSASPAAASSSSTAAAAYLAPGPSSSSSSAYLAPLSSSSASLAASLAAEAPSLASSAAAALAAEATSSMTPFTTNLGARTSSASAAAAAAAMGLTDPPSPPRRWLVVPVGAHGSPPRPGDSFRLAKLLGVASQEEREPEVEGERDARTYNNKRIAGECVAWILEAAGGAKKQRAA